ncbi:MAG: hypothetical protein RL754_262 [Bacteroidota bacterium]|jgi:uncharacterized protein (TIGR00159 family)
MGAIDFNILDALDIILVATLAYQVYRLLKDTAAIRILLGIVAIYLVYTLVRFLEMRLLTQILGSFISAGLLLLIIVFQQEIRKFLLVVGSATFSRRQGWKNLINLGINDEENMEHIACISGALEQFQQSKTGSLIVIERKDPLGSFAGSGHRIDAALSRIVLESIFFKNAPLHDGATIISGARVVASGCILPLSESNDLPSKFGLRHRAAAGITERTDAFALTVSEENGAVHLFSDGKFELLLPENFQSAIIAAIQA